MPRIDKLYAFIVEDSGPEDEGVPGFNADGQWFPLMGADLGRIDSLRPVAQAVANTIGKPMRLCVFKGRELVEVIEPKEDPE